MLYCSKYEVNMCFCGSCKIKKIYFFMAQYVYLDIIICLSIWPRIHCYLGIPCLCVYRILDWEGLYFYLAIVPGHPIDVGLQVTTPFQGSRYPASSRGDTAPRLLSWCQGQSVKHVLYIKTQNIYLTIAWSQESVYFHP